MTAQVSQVDLTLWRPLLPYGTLFSYARLG